MGMVMAVDDRSSRNQYIINKCTCDMSQFNLFHVNGDEVPHRHFTKPIEQLVGIRHHYLTSLILHHFIPICCVRCWVAASAKLLGGFKVCGGEGRHLYSWQKKNPKAVFGNFWQYFRNPANP